MALLTVTTSICSSVSTQLIYSWSQHFFVSHIVTSSSAGKVWSIPFLTPGKIQHSLTWPPLICFSACSRLYICLFLVIKDHFLIRLPSRIQQSNLFCSELPEKEMCRLSMASTPLLLHHPITPAACHFTLLNQTLPHSLFIYLPATLSVPFL